MAMAQSEPWGLPRAREPGRWGRFPARGDGVGRRRWPDPSRRAGSPTLGNVAAGAGSPALGNRGAGAGSPALGNGRPVSEPELLLRGRLTRAKAATSSVGPAA